MLFYFFNTLALTGLIIPGLDPGFTVRHDGGVCYIEPVKGVLPKTLVTKRKLAL